MATCVVKNCLTTSIVGESFPANVCVCSSHGTALDVTCCQSGVLIFDTAALCTINPLAPDVRYPVTQYDVQNAERQLWSDGQLCLLLKFWCFGGSRRAFNSDAKGLMAFFLR